MNKRVPVMSDRRDETRVGLGSPARARNRSNTPRRKGEAGLAPVSWWLAILDIGRRRSLLDIYSVARAELKTNPTITVYTFTGGVEQRRAANPWAGLTAAIKDTADAFARFAETFRRSSPRPPLRLIPGGRGTGPP